MPLNFPTPDPLSDRKEKTTLITGPRRDTNTKPLNTPYAVHIRVLYTPQIMLFLNKTYIMLNTVRSDYLLPCIVHRIQYIDMYAYIYMYMYINIYVVYSTYCLVHSDSM